ncbi:hypothetical protein LCGC14_2352440, partial [marine sediment metagenome]
MTTPTTKRCKGGCDQELPVSEFAPRYKTKSWPVQGYCRRCDAARKGGETALPT